MSGLRRCPVGMNVGFPSSSTEGIVDAPFAWGMMYWAIFDEQMKHKAVAGVSYERDILASFMNILGGLEALWAGLTSSSQRCRRVSDTPSCTSMESWRESHLGVS